jgi:Mg2+-importing ATPase
MARGSLRMSHKGVIVKRLAAIPNFGGMDVLCTDKTGTLTENNIQLVTYTNIEKKVDEKVLLYAYLNSFYQTGVKNPLDSAMLNFKKIPINAYKKVDEIPFDFNRKIMSVVVNNHQERIIISKGAPEELFKHCQNVMMVIAYLD